MSFDRPLKIAGFAFMALAIVAMCFAAVVPADVAKYLLAAMSALSMLSALSMAALVAGRPSPPAAPVLSMVPPPKA